MKRGAPEERPGRFYLSTVLERAKGLNLSPSKRLILIVLLRYMGDKDYCFPSQQTISENTGISLRQVKALLKELADPEKAIIEISTRR